MLNQLLKQTMSGGIKNIAASTVGTGDYSIRSGLAGLVKGGFIGFGIYTEMMSTGKEYGMGAGFIRGAAYSVPFVAGAMTLYDFGKMGANAAYDYQQAKRRSSFTRGFQDPFGTAATMRQRSQYNLSRGRASLGSEAFLFH
jgi:hypothetical protein